MPEPTLLRGAKRIFVPAGTVLRNRHQSFAHGVLWSLNAPSVPKCAARVEGLGTAGRTAARASTMRLKVHVTSTTERSRDATDASRAPRRLRRSGESKNIDKPRVGKSSLIWQHKSKAALDEKSIAASDQTWTSRTRRRRTPMPA